MGRSRSYIDKNTGAFVTVHYASKAERKRREAEAAAEADLERLRYNGPLRTAKGEMARLQRGGYFDSCQGEHFQMGLMDRRRDEANNVPEGVRREREHYSDGDAIINLIELNNGKWLAHPPGTSVSDPQWESREQAVRQAAAKVIRRILKRLRRKESGWAQQRVSPRKAQVIIDWALAVAGRPPRKLYDETAKPCPWPPGTRVEIFQGPYAGRTGAIAKRLPSETFAEFCYVDFDRTKRERTDKREMVAWRFCRPTDQPPPAQTRQLGLFT